MSEGDSAHFVSDRRDHGDRREVEELKRQLEEKKLEVRETKMVAALARVDERLAQTALDAAEAKEVAEDASEVADKAMTSVEAHERECVIRYQGIREDSEMVKSKLEKLEGVPQALVTLAERFTLGSAERQEQHASNQAAIAALTKTLVDKVGGDKSSVIILLWSLVGAMGAGLLYMLFTYALPSHP